MEINHELMAEGLRKGDRKAFEEIFNTYYKALCRYCARIVYDADVAEEIVQDLFCKLWVKREELEIETSLRAYLYRAVLNHSINYLNHWKTEEKYRKYIGFQTDNNDREPAQRLEAKEMQKLISLALQNMPQKRREIFQLSRDEGLKNQEIAEYLNISVKTVEAQMTKALDYFRKVLRDSFD
jgi:RNA polymerase sigma-70 factor (ECF subfamily)